MSVEVIWLGDGVDVVTDPTGAVSVVALSGVDVVSPDEGPQGPAGADGAQDIGFGPLTAPFAAGEIIDTPPLARAASYAVARFYSRTGVAADQTIAILTNGVEVASIVVAPASLPTKQTFDIGPLTFAAGDVVSLRTPNPADGQLADFTLSLGSTA